MQLLNSNEDENEYSPELFGQNMTDKGRENIQKNKKYSLWWWFYSLLCIWIQDKLFSPPSMILNYNLEYEL